jgi:hypothetical protein
VRAGSAIVVVVERSSLAVAGGVLAGLREAE